MVGALGSPSHEVPSLVLLPKLRSLDLRPSALKFSPQVPSKLEFQPQPQARSSELKGFLLSLPQKSPFHRQAPRSLHQYKVSQTLLLDPQPETICMPPCLSVDLPEDPMIQTMPKLMARSRVEIEAQGPTKHDWKSTSTHHRTRVPKDILARFSLEISCRATCFSAIVLDHRSLPSLGSTIQAPLTYNCGKPTILVKRNSTTSELSWTRRCIIPSLISTHWSRCTHTLFTSTHW